MNNRIYDLGIIGGGLSGLTFAIRMAGEGWNVALFEKKTYPFHRVCGEYVSLETLPYLRKLGFDPFEHGAVKISRLLVTGTADKELESQLDLGGFGLSRYTFDHELAKIARKAGVHIHEGTDIRNLQRDKYLWQLTDARNNRFTAKQLVGAQGKRSTLDALLNRSYLSKRSPYVGIKYHIRYDQEEDLIALHNFKNGYCGISRIEDDRYCLCYLCKNDELKKQGGIQELEQNILRQNPYLDDIFKRAEFIYEKPLAINEVTFSRKTTDEQGVKMIGDAAGMIAPLCGNGMAMAIHSSKLLADDLILNAYSYDKAWNKQFNTRLSIGRTIQKTFGSNLLTNATLSLFNALPFLKRPLIRLTHGNEF